VDKFFAIRTPKLCNKKHSEPQLLPPRRATGEAAAFTRVRGALFEWAERKKERVAHFFILFLRRPHNIIDYFLCNTVAAQRAC